MPKLVKNNVFVDNSWHVVREAAPARQGQPNILPLDAFLSLATDGGFDGETTGVWLAADDEPAALVPHLGDLKVIAIEFQAFTDGRGFSLARLLRDKYDYEHELRAIGNVIQDQLFYLSRCGFDAFEIDSATDIESINQSLNDFSEKYQAAADDQQPLFRRRA